MATNTARTAGATLWLLSIQYYVVQAIVAAAWSNTNSYSWAQNTISDMANTACGAYGDRLICSPLHSAMNTSFIVLGITMIAGSYMFAKSGVGRLSKFGLVAMAVSGVGTIVVGLFPENSVAGLHVLGAALPFALGNVGMVLIGVGAAKQPKALRLSTITAGVVGLLALVAFVLNAYGPFGIGGVERIVAYPQSIWMIAVGAYLLVRRFARPA